MENTISVDEFNAITIHKEFLYMVLNGKELPNLDMITSIDKRCNFKKENKNEYK